MVLGQTETLALAIFTITVCVALGWCAQITAVRKRRYPPGPPSKPLIGNIMSIGVPSAWIMFTEYKGKYGDLVYFQGLGKSVLVINSLKAMTDLLEKRANIYSGRPHLVFAHELMGLDRIFGLRDYGEIWRVERKLAHIVLSPAAVDTYDHVLEDIAIRYAYDLVKTPEDFYAKLRLATGRILLAITYGICPEHEDDEILVLAEEANQTAQKAAIPGSYLCDTLPFLKYAPSWVKFKQEAQYGWDALTNMMNIPFDRVKRDMEMDIAPPSLVQKLLEDPSGNVENLEDRIKGAAGGMYIAGTDTTYSTLLVFILAMAENPEVHRRAQAEVDHVVGQDRMPSIGDIPNLPYIDAVVKEAMRWHPSLPLGAAHTVSEDDEYEGYFIPKGTAVLANVWSIAFEPNEKYDPQKFIPERFLDPLQPVVDPSAWAFGFGRRICPGKFLARNSIFALVTTLLWAFDISPSPTGSMDMRFTEFLVSVLKPFDCSIIPRSESKANAIAARAIAATT
ncbi:hypothetical protein CERSUDRAFT_115946 [Gelatoporia subvermispora B]|uniref:Cytochrome P450 n=1 Tax=Ceriporiopsis subvermispora (strain B) TaxID=914234 RepID=M2QG53_CERS8|nr:hypothetical protein CERSUDRAFT_115946 [Gelatoporia subvermispora B]